MKRFWAVLLALIFVLSLGLAGCGETPQTPVTPPNVENGDGDGDGSDEDPPAPPEEEPMTFADFLETKKAAGKTFFTEHIRPAVTQAVVLAETVNFVAEEDDTELEQICYAYIYKTEGTARKYDVVNLTLPTPVSFDDIASGKAGDVTPSVQTVLSFGFDAKEDVERSDLKDALYNRIGKMSSKVDANARTFLGNITTKFSFGNTVYTYNVLSVKDNKINTSTIHLLAQDLDDTQLIERLNDDNKFKEIIFAAAGSNNETKSYTLTGENVFTSDYTAEFEKTHDPELEPDPTQKVGTIENLLTNYADEVNQGLKGAYEYMVNKIFPKHFAGFDKTKISETQWDFVVNENRDVSKINYFGKYDNRIIFIISISVDTPIQIDNLTNQNVAEIFGETLAENAATYNVEIIFNYDDESLIKYPGLAEAVYAAEGFTEEGAEFYISSQWGGSLNATLGHYRNTDILRVTATGVQNITVKISDDAALIENVRNGKYQASKINFYPLGGHSIAARDYAREEE